MSCHLNQLAALNFQLFVCLLFFIMLVPACKVFVQISSHYHVVLHIVALASKISKEETLILVNLSILFTRLKSPSLKSVSIRELFFW